MLSLIDWAEEDPSRHFLIRKVGTCIETRWRVCVWVKPEGESIQGDPGEGYGLSYEVAVDMALCNWRTQSISDRGTGINWYAQQNIINKLEEAESV